MPLTVESKALEYVDANVTLPVLLPTALPASEYIDANIIREPLPMSKDAAEYIDLYAVNPPVQYNFVGYLPL